MKRIFLFVALYSFQGIYFLYGQKSTLSPEKNLVPFSMIWETSKDSKLNLSFFQSTINHLPPLGNYCWLLLVNPE